MTTAEAAKIVGVLMSYYPDTFKSMNDEQTKTYITIWQKSFDDFEYKDVSLAVWDFIQNSTDDFMPKVGKIKQIINDQKFEGVPNEMEAFEVLMRARKKFNRYAPISDDDEYGTLPEPIKKAIGGRQGFMRIGDLNTETDAYSVEKTHFMKQYRAEIDKARKDASRPKWLSDAISERTLHLSAIDNEKVKELTDGKQI